MTFPATKLDLRKARDSQALDKTSSKRAMISIDWITAGPAHRIGMASITTIFACLRSHKLDCPWGAKTRLARKWSERPANMRSPRRYWSASMNVSQADGRHV